MRPIVCTYSVLCCPSYRCRWEIHFLRHCSRFNFFKKILTINMFHLAIISDKKMSLSSDSGLSDNEGSSGDEQKRIPVKKIFSNQQALRKRIDDLNGMLKTMEQQRSELQSVLQIVNDWTEDLRAVNRTNLGVPYIRAIKQLLGEFSTFFLPSLPFLPFLPTSTLLHC